MEQSAMNQDVFEGRWRQMRGTLKSWWGKLTDDDLDRIGGQKDKLIGWVQEKYGYTRDKAQQEVEQHLREYNMGSSQMGQAGSSQMGSSFGGSTGSSSSTGGSRGMTEAPSGMAATAQEYASGAANKAQEYASGAANRVSGATTAVGEKMGSLAGAIREKAPHEGTLGTAATAVADRLESAGSYLQEKGVENMVSDLTGLIRRYPIQSLLIGLGIGYLLARNSER